MKIVLSIIIMVFSTFLYSQSVTIKGKVISPADTTALGFSTVHFDNDMVTNCDSSGKFSLTLDKSILKDTLKISFIGFRQLFIVNLPKNTDTIDLGEIPMFYGNKGVPMADFFCRWIDFRCKRRAKLFWKNVEKENKEYVMKVNYEIDNYRYIYNDKKYRLKYNENYFNLTLTIDLLEPEKY
ncbi:MAG: hypothetical protein A2W91_00260 [Bacteroidetes bacterium GWF2_38_335]|nr:MAG: hypothetical protein A2W91_00260 [Bacteroidetes bacterium GWF2_38_335]OFY78266.1 MAG: hypothetical protein A2281_03640 [Bacteroidetes bacterium RIFOXYA12_FULL_38_20]HBS87540.1 hypothetical protein [Bacteroidales bacterium]